MAYGMGYNGVGNMGNGMQDGGMGWGQGATGRWNGEGSMNYNGDGSGGGYYSASSTSGGYSHQQFHENQFTAQQYHNLFQDGRSRQPFLPGGNNRGSIASAGSVGVGDIVGIGEDSGRQFNKDAPIQQDIQKNVSSSTQEQRSDVPGTEGSVEPQTNGHPVTLANTSAEIAAVTVAGTDAQDGREPNNDNNVLTAELPINNVPPGTVMGNGNEFYQNYMMNYPMGQYQGMNPAMNTYSSHRGTLNGGFRGGRGGHWGGVHGSGPPVVEKPPGQGLGVEGAPTGPKALREGFRGGRGGARGGFGMRRGGLPGSTWPRRSAYYLTIIYTISLC